MRIGDILKSKSTEVIALPPTAKVAEAITLMKRHNVGAVVIKDAQSRLLGVLSERDIVHALSGHGVLVSGMYVSQFMSTNGQDATMFDSVSSVMELMTRTRTLHLPIVDRANGTVVGLVSVGDVMKSRLEEKTIEVHTLQDMARAHLVAA